MGMPEHHVLRASRVWDTSLVVSMTDVVTARPPARSPTVTLGEELRVTPVVNQSGYVLFFGLDHRDAVTVHVDGGDVYQSIDEPVDLAAMRGATPREYEVDVDLTPTAAYPYPAGRTVLRGQVFERPQVPVDPADRTPVEEADVSIPPLAGAGSVQMRSVATETDSRGEFVLYFEPFTEAYRDGVEHGVTLSKANGGHDVKVETGPNATANPTVEVSHAAFQSATDTRAVRAGSTTTYDIELEPNP
jgi:hypothetical protein